jgi:uncharacterized protein (DUF2141 family)
LAISITGWSPREHRACPSPFANALICRKETKMRLAVFLIALLSLAAPATAADLVVKLSGLRKTQGNVVLCLWAAAGKFPDCEAGPVVARINVPATATEARFVNVAPGRYAVSGFHDANVNERMDTNIVGLPLEAVGLSNNPKAGFGPPRFKASQFDFSGDASISVRFGTM